MLMTKWQRVPEKRAWACGFCRGLSFSLTEFHKHIAVQHYECGEQREWDHTKVILGLLSQPHVADPWERLLATRFQLHAFLSCKWKKSKTRELQLRLELGREPGDVLALAALGCAIYDHKSLKDAYRHCELSTSDLDTRYMADGSGPPVPPKPLPSPHFPQDQSKSITRIRNETRKADISVFNSLENPGPQLLDSFLASTDSATHLGEQIDQGWLDQIPKESSTDFLDLTAMEMDLDLDFSRQLSFPYEIMNDCCHENGEQ